MNVPNPANDGREAIRRPTRALLLVLGWVLCVSAVLAQDTETTADEAPPLNVLLVVADDLNTEIGCYGSPTVQTPHIDSLAEGGVRFDLAICQSSICNPSRVSFLSGRHLTTTKVFGNGQLPRKVMEDVTFLPEHFRNHGYKTLGFGKIYHRSGHEKQQWDHYERLSTCAPDAPDPVVYDDDAGSARLLPRPTRNDDEHEPDGRVARAAVAQLEALAEDGNTPFFMTVGFRNPHGPRHFPQEYLDRYPLQDLPLQPLLDRQRDVAPVHVNFRDIVDDPELVRLARQAYYSSISFVDAQIGYLLDGLQRTGLSERTVVVLTSDHGYGIGEHGLFGKHTPYMNVLRVPLIVRVPGVEPAVCSRPVGLVSLYATLADLTGLPAPDGVEGRSLTPLLEDPQRSWDEYVFSRSAGFRSIVSEEYRYTDFTHTSRVALFHHKLDPLELNDLYSDEESADVRAELGRQLDAGWRGVDSLERESTEE